MLEFKLGCYTNLADIMPTLKIRANHNRSDLLNMKEAGCCPCATNSMR